MRINANIAKKCFSLFLNGFFLRMFRKDCPFKYLCSNFMFISRIGLLKCKVQSLKTKYQSQSRNNTQFKVHSYEICLNISQIKLNHSGYRLYIN
jgi:hypothetical protein